jgi:L-lactate utilization protein LutC
MATINNSEQQVLKSKKNKFGTFVMNHKMVFFLLISLIVVLGWALIKMYLMNNQFEKQTAELKTKYENRIDSLTAQQLELTSKTFAWAVRSELIRDNKEQVNQFFSAFIKEQGIIKVEFVDAITSRVTLSTDKKDEGMVFEDPIALVTEKVIHLQNDSILTIYSPVMGLNSKLGSLIIKYQK